MVAAKVYEVISAETKPLRVPMDRARVLTWVRSLAPQAVIDRLIGGLLATDPTRSSADPDRSSGH
jgi:hypothetical protein